MIEMTSKKWLLMSAVILLLSAGWIWSTRAAPGSDTSVGNSIPYVGFQAPDFRLQTTSGDMIALSDYHDQPVLINIWASWCPPCRAEMPAMEQVYKEYQDQGFVVLAVNATNQDNPSLALSFAEENNLTFPILLDMEGVVSRQYNVQSLPTSFFIDRFGKIQEIVVGGPMAEALLRIRTEQLLIGD
ncbi:MAG: TlpA disulfide reductase family protein [Anaerolineales bacterium]|jgi:peroxiredoxin